MSDYNFGNGKKRKLDHPPNEETKEEIDNGNGKIKSKLQLRNSEVKLEVDEETKKALAKGDSVEEAVNEPTKYILLDHALVESVHDDRVKHFTKYLDRDEVLQMNDVETHARLIPIVFKSKHAEINKHIEKIAELFPKHAHDHMDNMMALDNKSMNVAKLLVMALRQDNNPLPSDKEMKKMFSR